MMASSSASDHASIRLGVVLAPVLAGSLAAATNLLNFEYSRTTYFIVWGAAHLLALGFGLWAASLLGRRPSTGTCVGLGLLAGGVEAFIVFQLLNHLIVVTGDSMLELIVGPEDYVAVVATVMMFAAGAMRHLRKRALAVTGNEGTGVSTRSAPSATVTQFFSTAGPSIVAVATLLKMVLA
jgi:hypothetical protein